MVAADRNKATPRPEQLLLVRADASARIGTGHVMRCLALAQAWESAGGSVRFAFHSCPEALVGRIRQEGPSVERIVAEPGSDADAAELIALAERYSPDWVVVDGYSFGATYQDALYEKRIRTLVIDDNGHAERYRANVVLNQNVYAGPSLYPDRAEEVKLLLGLDYALLRREFWPWQGWRRPVPPRAKRVLVTLGGSDPANVTGRMIRAFGQLDDPTLRLVVLIGAGAPHGDTVEKQAQADDRVEVMKNVTDMPALMTWADIGVTAGGSTCYETALLGLPCLVAVLAENQRAVAEGLVAEGVIELLGDHEAFSVEDAAAALDALVAAPERRASMAEAGQRLVPGGGAMRVVQVMQHHLGDAAASAAPSDSSPAIHP